MDVCSPLNVHIESEIRPTKIEIQIHSSKIHANSYKLQILIVIQSVFSQRVSFSSQSFSLLCPSKIRKSETGKLLYILINLFFFLEQ